MYERPYARSGRSKFSFSLVLVFSLRSCGRLLRNCAPNLGKTTESHTPFHDHHSRSWKQPGLLSALYRPLMCAFGECRRSRRSQLSFGHLPFTRAGRALHARCNNFQNADDEVKDLVLLTAALSGRIDRQLLVLRRTCSSLPETYLDLQEQMLDRLQSKIKELMSKVDRIQTITEFQRCVVERVKEKGAVLTRGHIRWRRPMIIDETDNNAQESQVRSLSQRLSTKICRRSRDNGVRAGTHRGI